MKVLRYKEENVDKIASETGIDAAHIRAELIRSIELSLPIYSVVGFIAFGTLEIRPTVRFIAKVSLDEHYKYPDNNPMAAENEYTEVVPKYDR